MMSPRAKNILKMLIRIAVTSALLIWVFSKIDTGQFLGALKAAKWRYVIALWAATLGIFYVASNKMLFILKKQGCETNVLTVFAAGAMTALYGMIMPGVLSTSVKWYILRRSTGKGTNVLSSMIYNQFSDMLVVIVVGLAALAVTAPTRGFGGGRGSAWAWSAVCVATLAATVAVGILLLSARTGRKVTRALALLAKPLPGVIRQKVEQIFEQIEVFQVVGWRFHLVAAALVLVGRILGGVLMFVFAAKAAQVTVPIIVLVWLAGIIHILRTLPISIANLGVREFTLVGLLAGYGVQPPDALVMSMMLFSASLFMALVGAMFQLFWRPQSAGQQRQEESAPG